MRNNGGELESVLIFLPLNTLCSLSLLFLQSVCGQHTEDHLHQCGRFHFPGSLREGPLHFAVTTRPLWLSGAPAWLRDSRESISGRSTLVPLRPPCASMLLGPQEAKNSLREKSFTGLIALPRMLHSCSSVPCGLSLTAPEVWWNEATLSHRLSMKHLYSSIYV